MSTPGETVWVIVVRDMLKLSDPPIVHACSDYEKASELFGKLPSLYTKVDSSTGILLMHDYEFTMKLIVVDEILDAQQ